MDWVHRALVIAAAGCLIAVLFVLPSELRSARVAVLASEDWYFESLPPAPEAPLSLHANYAVHMACDAAMADPVSDLMPLSRRAGVWSACLELSERVLAQSPDFALAHQLRAAALIGQGAFDEGYSALEVSAGLAPNLSWMASRRLDLLLEIGAATGQDLRDALARDLALLLRSGRGRQVIAQQYLSSDDARTAITDAVETLPSSSQAALVRALQTARAADG